MEETVSLPVLMIAVTDCKSLFDALRVDETAVPSENSLIMILLQIKESLRTGSLSALAWCDTRDMLADALNKGAVARKAIVEFSCSASWVLNHPFVMHHEKMQMSIPSNIERDKEELLAMT